MMSAAIGSTYPLFFCGTPDDEPTCVPSRPGEYSGAIAADDLDGDGFLDGDDNCPAIFNPPMLIEPGVQPDADGDGKGDACDTCPSPNPGFSPCAIPIEAIRDPNHPDHPPEGAVVAVVGAYVTGIRPATGNSRGFHIETGTQMPYTGIFV